LDAIATASASLSDIHRLSECDKFKNILGGSTLNVTYIICGSVLFTGSGKGQGQIFQL